MTLQNQETPSAPRPTFAAAATADAADALAQTLLASLDKVADALAEEDAVAMVHDARKALKEYRSLLRLVPGAQARAARQAAAATARLLSAARDRQAARDALSALADAHMIPRAEAAQAAALIDAAPAAANESEDQRTLLSEYLATARAAHADHLTAAARDADVAAGLRKAYAKARKAKDWESPEGLHDLRKRVVTHRYQMSFLADFCGGSSEKQARRAQRLRDILGLYQDLETLKPLLAGALGTAHEGMMSEVAAASRGLQRRLLKKAQERHEKLFRHAPHAFQERLSRDLPDEGDAPESLEK